MTDMSDRDQLAGIIQDRYEGDVINGEGRVAFPEYFGERVASAILASDPLRLALQNDDVIRRLAAVKTPDGVRRVLAAITERHTEQPASMRRVPEGVFDDE